MVRCLLQFLGSVSYKAKFPINFGFLSVRLSEHQFFSCMFLWLFLQKNSVLIKFGLIRFFLMSVAFDS